MSIYQRIPAAPLNQYIAWLWYYVDYYPDHDRQFVLPDGTLELIINLEERPRKLFDRRDQQRYRSFRRGWISGAQREYLTIDALPGSSMIGVHFLPGGAAPFLGMPCDEISGQVVELNDLWGAGASDWRERLLAANGPQTKLALLEELLLERLRLSSWKRDRQATISWALRCFIGEPHLQRIQDVSNRLGMSHKHFIDRFRREVGVTPKLFCRIFRFQHVLRHIQANKKISWADLACSCGYFDQAHFVNDFVGFAGVNPTAYLHQRLEGDTKFVRART